MTKARSLSDFIESDGSVTLVDNQKIKVGTGNDLEIYHDGSNSIINDAGTGTIRIQSGGTNQWEFNGVNFKGNDNRKIILGDSSDLQIYHDGSNSYIKDAGTGRLNIQSATDFLVANTANSQNYIYAQESGYVRLYHSGSTKLETTSTGIDVTGTVTSSDGLSVEGGKLTINEFTGASAYTQIRKTNSGSNLAVVSQESIYMLLDENNDQTNRGFFVEHGSGEPGAGTTVFSISESGTATLNSGNFLVNTTSSWGGETTPHIESRGDVAGDYTGLIVSNTNDAAGDSVSVNFGLARDGGLVFGNAGKITVGKEQDWTTTASTVDGFMSFSTIQNENVEERLRINSSGDVLIGQTSQTGYGFAQKLVVGDGDDNDGITIQSGSTHQGNLAFNHSDGTTAHGRISYQHGSNYMQFFVNNTEALRLDANQWVLLNGGNAQQYSDNQRTYSGSESVSWSSSTSANTWTSSYYMAYQKFVEAGVHLGYVGNGAISSHFKLSLMNHFSGLSIQTLHSAFGQSGNAYHTISFTSGGAYNTRTLKIVNTPASGQNSNGLNGTIYYGLAI